MEKQKLVTLSLFINEERIPGKGEDSYLCICGGSAAALIASLDGCGGAGGHVYKKANFETGARIAAYHVGKAIKEWFLTSKYGLGLEHKEAEHLAEELKAVIDCELARLNELHNAEGSGIQSRSIRGFPTTLAMVIPEVIDVNTVRYLSFWAGDSRTYLFPTSGLIQTSTDDVRGGGDPFVVLERDSVLSNVISADVPYQINLSETIVREPCMILSATDGCFSYLSSPMEFEWLLLDTLMAAKSPAEWERFLSQIFGEYAGDDYTLGIAVIGFRNWKAIKTAYEPRWKQVRNQYCDPLADILKQGDRQAHYALWEQYKQRYLLIRNKER